jgi:hypothetical protein
MIPLLVTTRFAKNLWCLISIKFFVLYREDDKKYNIIYMKFNDPFILSS